jgi:hypothetical protein
MGLLDIIRKPLPKAKQPNLAMVASPAEFITALLLNDLTGLPLAPAEQDAGRKTANELAVSSYRRIFDQKGVGPSKEMSDALIVDIYRRVGCAFRKVAKQRGEFIESAVVNGIVLKFLEVYRTTGSEFFEAHLEYEIQKFATEGLRPDYSQKRLDLFG